MPEAKLSPASLPLWLTSGEIQTTTRCKKQSKVGDTIRQFYYHGNQRKYGNSKAKRTIDGKVFEFDSNREALRFDELRLMQRAGEIHGLAMQQRFKLIPSQRDKSGKVIERAVDYVADFVYVTKDGEMVVEDTKGFKTKDYIIKRKLMLWVHGIRVREI